MCTQIVRNLLVWLDRQYTSRYEENGFYKLPVVADNNMSMNHDDLYPMNRKVLEMENPEKLTVEYWLLDAMRTKLGDPERIAYKCVREERDARIAKILESRGMKEWVTPDYWEHFHGYVTEVQRKDWEEKSGKTAILPE